MTLVRGSVFVRLPDGSISAVRAGASLEFIKEDLSSTFTAASNSDGRYSITLDPGLYYLRATHADFEDYTSAPGFRLVIGASQTCDFFLREPQITTVIVIRHGEKQNPTLNGASEPLSNDGRKRASVLRRVLFRAGVTRIWVSETVRAHDTAETLAESLELTSTDYSPSLGADVAEDVLQNNEGDVVLVVAHANTIREVVTALGSSFDIDDVGDDDFDNMFVVSRAGSQVNVLNLQYGANTSPNSARNFASAMTVLLVGVDGAGTQAPANLVHAARGAGLSAIYVSENRTAMVSPLATRLGIIPESYQPTEILQLVERLLTRHQPGTVVVSGTHDDLRAVIRQLGGRRPILYPSDVDHLIVLTRFPSGAVRVVPMRL